MKRYVKDHRKILPIALLILSVLAGFGKILISGESLSGGDFLVYFYPLKRFILDHVVTHGVLPLWNPYQFAGTSLIANMQASMFYPLGFLYYLMPPDLAYGYSTILHFILGSLFMYAFVRKISLSRMGAFLSAFVFAFNGFLMGHLYAGHLTFVQNYIWIPLIFLLMHELIQSGDLKYAVTAGLVLGVQILGGFPQIAFYTILAMLLYALFNIGLFILERRRQKIRPVVIATAAMLIIGFSLAALQLLPTYEFTQLSTRSGGVSYEFATLDSMPPKHFLTFIIPHIFGTPLDGTFWGSPMKWQFWEFCGYVGILPWILILGSIRRLVKDPIGLFFLLLLAMALFLSLGKYNPFYRIIYHLPGFNDFRIPAQILFLYVFSIAVLAGKGLDYLKAHPVRLGPYRLAIFSGLSFFIILAIWVHVDHRSFFTALFKLSKPTGISYETAGQIYFTVTNAILKSLAVFVAIAIVLYLFFKRRTSFALAGTLLIMILMVDIGSFSLPMIRSTDLDPLKNQGSSLEPIRRDPGMWRMMALNGCLIWNTGLWFGVQDIQGYDPLILKRYMEYINRSQDLGPDNKIVNIHYVRHLDNHLINMLNLKYVVDCESARIVQRSDFVQRAYIVHQMVRKDEHEILDFMMGKQFNPKDMVVLEQQSNLPKFNLRQPRSNLRDSCRIVAYHQSEITVEADLKTPGFMVMSEINYPGWKVFVDGEKREILTGNYLFRTVPLEAGHHTVRFLYNPLSFTLGIAISGAALIAVVIFFLFRLYSKGYSRREFV